MQADSDLLDTDVVTGKRTRLADMAATALRALAAARLPYAVIGAAALAVRGLPRMTRDLGVVVLLDDAFAALDALLAAGFRSATPVDRSSDPEPMYVLGHVSLGGEVDLLVAAGEPESTVIDQAEPAPVFGVPAPVASLEHLVLAQQLDHLRMHLAQEAAAAPAAEAFEAGLRVTAMTHLAIAAWLAIAGTGLAGTVAPLTTDQVLALYPRRETNPAALELAERAAALGIDVWRDGRVLPYASAGPSFRMDVLEPIEASLEALRRADGPALAGLAATAERFLDERAPELERLRDLLQRGGPFHFAADVTRWRVASVARIDRLRLVVLGASLDAAARGDAATALGFLDASFALDEVTAGDTSIPLQLIGARRWQAALLRQLEDPSGERVRRLGGAGLRDSLRTFLLVDAWWMEQAARDPALKLYDFGAINKLGTDDEDEWRERLGKWVASSRPVIAYVRLCVAAAAKSQLDQVAAGDPLDPCQLAAAGLSARAEAQKPWWRAGGIGPVHGDGLRARLARALLEIELTERVQALRAARRAAGEWPAALPLGEGSICAGGRWVNERDETGAWLRYQPPPAFPGSGEEPIRFRLE